MPSSLIEAARKLHCLSTYCSTKISLNANFRLFCRVRGGAAVKLPRTIRIYLGGINGRARRRLWSDHKMPPRSSFRRIRPALYDAKSHETQSLLLLLNHQIIPMPTLLNWTLLPARWQYNESLSEHHHINSLRFCRRAKSKWKSWSKKSLLLWSFSGVSCLVRKAWAGLDYRRWGEGLSQVAGWSGSGVPIISNYGVLCHLLCVHKIYVNFPTNSGKYDQIWNR